MTQSQRRRKIKSGFDSLREGISYVIGTATLFYGVVESSPDKALIVISAGAALIGAPMVGSVFGKKTADKDEESE